MNAVTHQTKVFTTGQIAKYCHVAPRTASGWIDSGLLKGYRVPGGKDRRVPRENLIRFMLDHGMPLGPLETPSIIVVSADAILTDQLRRELSAAGYEPRITTSLVGAGALVVTHHTVAIVVDYSIGIANALQCSRQMAARGLTVIAVVPDGDGWSFDRSAVTETFKKPFDVALLAERVRTLVGV